MKVILSLCNSLDTLIKRYTVTITNESGRKLYRGNSVNGKVVVDLEEFNKCSHSDCLNIEANDVLHVDIIFSIDETTTVKVREKILITNENVINRLVSADITVSTV